MPFENSTHGPVTFTLDGLADRDGVYGDLAVCGEAYLAVHHFLLGRVPAGAVLADSDAAGTPLTSLAAITRVYSHPQAFGQTTAFFRKHFSSSPAPPELIDASSTSRAAELAAADASGASAAVSSALAAETTGLAVLARQIEDRPDNTTRFYVLAGGQQAGASTPARRPKSLVSFTVPHHSPGALADVLDCFRRAQLNLTSINSLPSLRGPFQYLFFVEFVHGGDEGGGGAEETPDERVRRVLADVAKVAQTYRLLGTWDQPEPLGR